MKIVYMGTPDFAVAPLAALVENGYEVEAVITQPDKPKGRGKTMMPTPVKEEALKHEIPVLQPVKVRDPEFVEKLKSLAPDIIVVAAFGQIIPKSILDMPKFGCINIHASLLPKYRGAAPIQQAVIDGEKESGVTIMQMGTGLDTGDMISRIVVPLSEDETGGSLFDKLAVAGAELLVQTLPYDPVYRGWNCGLYETAGRKPDTICSHDLQKNGTSGFWKKCRRTGAAGKRPQPVAECFYLYQWKNAEGLEGFCTENAGRESTGNCTCRR